MTHAKTVTRTNATATMKYRKTLGERLKNIEDGICTGVEKAIFAQIEPLLRPGEFQLVLADAQRRCRVALQFAAKSKLSFS